MGTDVQAVREAIRDAVLCVVCLARTVGAAPFSILSALAILGTHETIIDTVAKCDGCLEVKHTHRLGPSRSPFDRLGHTGSAADGAEHGCLL